MNLIALLLAISRNATFLSLMEPYTEKEWSDKWKEEIKTTGKLPGTWPLLAAFSIFLLVILAIFLHTCLVEPRNIVICALFLGMTTGIGRTETKMKRKKVVSVRTSEIIGCSAQIATTVFFYNIYPDLLSYLGG